MVIDYVSKVSKFLSRFKYLFPLGAIVFAVLYWTINQEIFLTLLFACASLYFLCGGLAHLIEIKHCLRKEEMNALKVMGILSLVAAIIFLVLIISRII